MNIKDRLERYADKMGNHITLVGFGLGILYWITKSIIYAHTFKDRISIHLFHLGPDDLLIRLIVVSTFTLFGYILETMVVRRKREELLQSNERTSQERAKLEAVMQQMPFGVVIAEAPSGRVILANKQEEEIWRQPITLFANIEEYGKWKGFHLEDGRPYRGEEWPLARSLLHGEAVIDEKIEILRGDGTRSMINVRSAPIHDSEGKITTAVVTFNDISGRIQAEKTRSLLTAVVEFTEDGIISKTLDGIITSWNHGAEKIYGYSAEEAIGRSISLIIPPERLPDELSEILGKLRRGESIGHYETLRMRKDRKQIDVDLTISPLRDATGMIFGAAAIERDITEQKRAAEELLRYRFHLEELVEGRTHELMTVNSQLQDVILKYKQTQEALEKSLYQNRLILDSVGEGIYGVDLKGNTTFVNPTALAMTGYEAEELIGRHQHELLHHSRADGNPYPPEECPIYATMIDGIPRYNADEELFWRRDGSSFPVEYTSTPIQEKGRITGAVVVFKDIAKRKQAEEDIRQSQALLVAAQRLAHVGSFEWDIAPDKVSCSEELCRIFGIEGQEPDISLADWITQIVYPEDQDYVRNLFEKACHDKEPFPYQHRGIRRDGSVCILQGSAEVFTDAAGNPLKIVGSVQDITELKQAENALRESEKKYRLIVENAQEGIWVVDTEANTTFVNSSLAKMLGYTVDEMTGKPIYSFMNEQNRALARFYFERRKQGIDERLEFELLHKDGSTVYASLATAAIFDDSGHFAGAQALVTDITERKRAEEALRKQALIINQTHDAVISVDLDGYVTSWNKGAERLYGYSEEEALDKHISLIYPEDEKDFFEARLIPFLREAGSYEIEARRTKKTGEEISVHLSFSLLRDNAGTITGVIGYSVDITERKRAEEEKEKIQAQLLQSQKMEAIGFLAGGVAHDFNNLLTAIQGYTTLALRHISDPDPASRDLYQVKKSADRAANLTRQLLLFSRKQLMEPALLDLNRIIDDLLKMLYRLIGEDIAIVTELEPHLWPTMADEGTIEQVIMNLAVNARDAMPKGGRLTIRTENVILDEEYAQNILEARAGNFIRLSIADTGSGMDAKTIERIFEPFFTTKGVGKGTGLGLSVVYGIIKQHEGWINISSEPGKGSVFKIFLPALLTEAKKKEEEIIPLQRLQGKGERILVVEDEEEVRRLTVRMLRENHYTVDEASSVQEALNGFGQERGKFHVVVSDVVLPDQTGLELVEHLLLKQPDLHVLLVSGYTDQKAQWPIIREKGFHFLQKPYSLPDLLRTLREIIEAKSPNTTS